MSENDAQAEAEAMLTQLAATIALLPQELPEGEEPAPEGTIALPVVEQDGTSYVPVFTSRESLAAAGADPDHAVEVALVQLAAGWPSDELWLAVDPASENALTLPPDVVRALPGFVGAGPNGTL
ncbi:SseB family protein [Nocardioides anomalus]|uniref:SseB family protein n=1 Tax=Nocardioides anomalus TaxID=2712223 RepID=A0A6G6WG88_9ACTN|nr:SseB family protein [Nocardioides anomalus]QIG44361.1 SseB family protein [Nocardioides anomalus]